MTRLLAACRRCNGTFRVASTADAIDLTTVTAGALAAKLHPRSGTELRTHLMQNHGFGGPDPTPAVVREFSFRSDEPA